MLLAAAAIPCTPHNERSAGRGAARTRGGAAQHLHPVPDRRRVPNTRVRGHVTHFKPSCTRTHGRAAARVQQVRGDLPVRRHRQHPPRVRAPGDPLLHLSESFHRPLQSSLPAAPPTPSSSTAARGRMAEFSATESPAQKPSLPMLSPEKGRWPDSYPNPNRTPPPPIASPPYLIVPHAG